MGEFFESGNVFVIDGLWRSLAQMRLIMFAICFIDAGGYVVSRVAGASVGQYRLIDRFGWVELLGLLLAEWGIHLGPF